MTFARLFANNHFTRAQADILGRLGESVLAHNHDALYAPLSHTHSQYATTGHNHDAAYAPLSHGHTFASLSAKPTTLAGYGITDAATAGHTHSYLPLSGGNLTGTTSLVMADARLRFTAANGYAYIQAGDPDPDNSGGKLRITGFFGSTADEVRIDTNNLNVLGTPVSLNGHTHSQYAPLASPTFTGVVSASRLDIANPDGTFTHFNHAGTGLNYVRGQLQVTGPASSGSPVVSIQGALGQQTTHYSLTQGGSRLWNIGLETDRAWKLWSYQDAGAYMGNPVTIHRDAVGLTGSSTGWTIAGSRILTDSNFNTGRLGETASLAVSDFNAMQFNGWWMTTGGTNSPPAVGGNWLMVKVTRHNADWIQQEAFQFTASAGTTRYHRHNNGGTWGAWTHNQHFGTVYVGGWFTNDSTGYNGLMAASDGSYMIMTTSSGPTYVGARSGQSVIIRPNNNDGNGEVGISTDGVYCVQPIWRRSPLSSWTKQPTIFIQSADPGAHAVDNDLWGW